MESARAELLAGVGETPDYNSRDPLSPMDTHWSASRLQPPRNIFDDVWSIAPSNDKNFLLIVAVSAKMKFFISTPVWGDMRRLSST